MKYTVVSTPSEVSTKPNVLQEASRHTARSASRVGETAFGTMGDIIHAVPNLAQRAVQGVMGEPPRQLPQNVAQESPGPLSNTTGGMALTALSEGDGTGAFELPTSQSLKDFTNKASKGYLKPQNKYEEASDEIVSDLTSILLPQGLGVGKMPLARTLSAVGAGNAAKWFTKAIGGGEKTQAGAKMGSMLLVSAVNPGGLKRSMKGLYVSAEAGIPENVAVNIEPFEKSLAKVLKWKDSSISSPTTEKIEKTLEELSQKVVKDKMPLNALVETKKRLNEIAFQRDMTPTGRKVLTGLKNDILDVFKETARTRPEFAEAIGKLFQADDIYKAMHDASPIKTFLNKHVNINRLASPATSVLLGLHPRGTLVGSAAGVGVRGAFNAIEPFVKSGNVRQYYKGVLQAAIKNNATAAITNVTKLDRELAKFDKKPAKYTVVSMPEG